MKFIRTCQECGHKQEDKRPTPNSSEDSLKRFDNRKCKKCKSEALDYGSEQPSTPEEIEEEEKKRNEEGDY